MSPAATANGRLPVDDVAAAADPAASVEMLSNASVSLPTDDVVGGRTVSAQRLVGCCTAAEIERKDDAPATAAAVASPLRQRYDEIVGERKIQAIQKKTRRLYSAL